MENSDKTYSFLNGANFLNKENQISSLTEINNNLLKKIDNLSKKIQEKDFQILSLKTDIASLDSDKKSLNSKIIKKNEQIEKLEKNLKKFNKELIENEIEYNFNGIYNTLLDKDLNNDLGKLKNELFEKNKQIYEYQKMILDLKKDNTNILSNSEQYSQNIEQILSNLKNECSIEIDKRDKYINELKIQLSNYDKDYNNLINYIIEQFSNITQLIENNDITNLNNYSFEYEKIKNDNLYNFPKYEIIIKNFKSLLRRIFEIRFNDNEELKNCEELIKSEREKNIKLEKELNDEKTERISERNDIISMDEIIKENSNEIQRLNNTITNIINKTEELENENKFLLNQLNQFKYNINNLLDQNVNIFFNFINSHHFKNENLDFPFSSLPSFSYINDPELKLKNINDSLEILFSYINNNNINFIEKENSNFKNSNEPNKSLNELINNKNPISISNFNENDKKTNKSIDNKILEISQLLIESNKCLAKSQSEKNQLLQKNRDLQSQFNNLDLNNFSSVDYDKYDDKKIINLKNEIKLKDFQIQSLEKLINQINQINENKNDIQPFFGKIISNKAINKIQSGKKQSFVKNDKNERELNNLLNKLNNDFDIYNSYIDNSFSESIISKENNDKNNNRILNKKNINKK